MLNLQRLRSLSGGQGNERTAVWRLLSSKPAKFIVTGFLAISFALIWLRVFRTSHHATGPIPQIIGDIQDLQTLRPSLPLKRNARLHLLVPATSTNPDLCKLLLSAQILGYPTPVLVNYGDHEAWDAYVQHLAKVEGILHYLEQLETSEDFVEDLVLIIDGYDIWFQLRPDVLIKRFYEINAAADARAIEIYGEELVHQHDIRQTVVFGPDKICWPVDFSRPACWAVPTSPLPETAFGSRVTDKEDRDRNQARWLNSGTVLGSAQDLKEVFAATLEAINTNHTTDSDQFYFANIWGEQEYARLSRKPELLEEAKKVQYFDNEDESEGFRAEPDIQDRKTEYHIGIDYYSSMFQTLAFWKQHLSWSQAIDSFDSPFESSPYTMPMAEDIGQSAPPFEALKYGQPESQQPSWSEVDLAYNVITKQQPVLLHVTGNPGEKRYRGLWWQKLWFQSQAEQLRSASQKIDQRQISTEPIHGMYWFNAEGGDAEEIVSGGKGGAWTDRRGWLSWKRVCKAHENEIYWLPDDEFWHPKPKELEEESPAPPEEEAPADEPPVEEQADEPSVEEQGEEEPPAVKAMHEEPPKERHPLPADIPR